MKITIKCPNCFEQVSRENRYCTFCGYDLTSAAPSGEGGKSDPPGPGPAPEPPPYDDPRYCPDCGNSLDKNGCCSNCDPAKALASEIKSFAKDYSSGKIKGIIACIIAAVVFFLPTVLSDEIKSLTEGSAEANNAYVEKFNEWEADLSVTKNDGWLDSYDEASDALYRVNARGFDVDPDKLDYRELYSYINYFEASYLQMAVLQKTNEEVHSGDASGADDLSAYFNETLDLQATALLSGARLNLSKITVAENMVTDSIRYYLSFMPGILFGISLLIAGFAAAVAAVVLRIRSKNPSPFTERAESEYTPEETAAAEQKHKAFLKQERITAAVGTLAGILIIVVLGAVSLSKTPQAPPSFESRIHAAYMSDGTELFYWLTDCRTDPDKAAADVNKIRNITDDMSAHLGSIIQTPEADEDIVGVSEELMKSLSTLNEELDNGRLPDPGFAKQMMELLIKGMGFDSSRLIEDAFDSIGDLF